MNDIASILGWFGLALLFAAVAAWFKQGHGSPLLQRLNGRASLKTEEAEGAARLLIVALVVSAVAAVLGITPFLLR